MSAFKTLFNRVCDDFNLSPEARDVAWRSCYSANWRIRPKAVRIYLMLAGTKTPYLPR
jgi:hypothetical protein